jgi:hypothetical protein
MEDEMGQDQKIEMTARDLLLLVVAMGVADEVTVTVGQRIAEEYWRVVARTPRHGASS